MTIVDTRKIFDKVKREAEAAAENDDGFTMDPAKGLTVEVTKGSGKNERVETLCLSAPFEILGRVRDLRARVGHDYCAGRTMISANMNIRFPIATSMVTLPPFAPRSPLAV